MNSNYWIAPSVTGSIIRVCGVPKDFGLLGYSLDGNGIKGSVCSVPAFEFSADGNRHLLQIEDVQASLRRLMEQVTEKCRFNMLPFFVGDGARKWHLSLSGEAGSPIALPKGWSPSRERACVGVIGGRQLDAGAAEMLVNYTARATENLVGRVSIVRPGTIHNTVFELLSGFAKSRFYDIHPVTADWDSYGRAAYRILNYELVYRCDYFILVNDGSAEASHMIDVCQRFGLPFRLYETNKHKEIKYA